MKISEDHSTGSAAVRNKTQLWSKLQLTTWRQMEGQRQTAPWEGLAPTSLVRAVCKGNRMQMGVKAAKRHGKRGDWTSSLSGELQCEVVGMSPCQLWTFRKGLSGSKWDSSPPKHGRDFVSWPHSSRVFDLLPLSSQMNCSFLETVL